MASRRSVAHASGQKICLVLLTEFAFQSPKFSGEECLQVETSLRPGFIVCRVASRVSVLLHGRCSSRLDVRKVSCWTAKSFTALL